jgi:hypothetical protein
MKGINIVLLQNINNQVNKSCLISWIDTTKNNHIELYHSAPVSDIRYSFKYSNSLIKSFFLILYV